MTAFLEKIMEEIVFLMKAYSDLERGIATVALENAGIPYSLKDYESGNYMRLISGGSIYGCEIYVDSQDYEEAVEVIIGVLGPGIFEKQENE